jgi:hypothetical protein
MPHSGLKNVTTWGGNIIYDNKTSTHHLFVSRMTNDCNLVEYSKNSRIDHAVSATGPTGPFIFRDVAIPTWSHNAAPITLPDGSFAIFHVGAGTGSPNGGVNCTNSSRQPSVLGATFQDLARDDRSTYGVHVSRSLDGPWTAVPGVKACNNPAPWVHPNGTIYLWCGSLLRADSIAGPYTRVGNQTLSGVGVQGHLEDPQIWTDKRGNWHCLFHVFQCECGLPFSPPSPLVPHTMHGCTGPCSHRHCVTACAQTAKITARAREHTSVPTTTQKMAW